MISLTTDFQTTRDAIGLVYASYLSRQRVIGPGRDRDVRHPEWTTRILEELRRPDAGTYNVVVTGSKGKGSHATLLAGALQRLGFRVGLFTGPHLVNFMERFRVNGQMMPEDTFIALLKQVNQVVDKLAVPADQYIGPVGILTAVAALWFQAQATDVNIYECGRGALHDDVNQVVHHGTVLTPVFLEHVRELGPTLMDIAKEKLGVMTEDTRWMVAAEQSPVVEEAIRSTVAEPEIRQFGRDFKVRMGEGNSLVVCYPQNERLKVHLPFTNGYWVQNAGVAVDAARQVWKALCPDREMPGMIDLRSLQLRGRLDVIQSRPLVVVDGTIHTESAVIVRNWIRVQGQAQRIDRVGAILAIPADKDGCGVLSVLASSLDWVIVTHAHNPNLNFDGTITAIAREHGMEVFEAPYLEEAWVRAQDLLRPTDALLVLGTQSFVGDALSYFRVDTSSIWIN